MIGNALRISRIRSVSAFLLFVAIGSLLSGCGSSPTSTSESNTPSTLSSQITPNSNPTAPSGTTPASNPTAPPATTPTSATSTSCTAQTDIICGRLVDSQGHPLGGANGSVAVSGISTNGEQLNYPLVRPGPDGTYSLQVADGAYVVFAYANPTYQGVTWNLFMHPDDNVLTGLPSASGIVKNFTWELSGLEPPPADGTPLDPANPFQHYGAYIGLNGLYGCPPVGSVFQFTLTPQGPLVDGTTGQTLVFKETVASAIGGQFSFTGGGQYSPALSDIPLGVYSLAITAADPGSNAISLQYDYWGSTHNTVQWGPDPAGIHNGSIDVTDQSDPQTC